MTKNTIEPKVSGFKLVSYSIIVAVVFGLLTLVVIMLVTGTLQIVGRDLIRQEYLELFSITAAFAIAIISIAVFVRNFKKIYNHLEMIISRKR